MSTDLESIEQAIVENLHREDLTPLEEASAYQQLIEDFSMTHEQVAIRVGRSRASVTLSAGYKRTSSQTRWYYVGNEGYTYSVDRIYQRLVVNVGVSF